MILNLCGLRGSAVKIFPIFMRLRVRHGRMQTCGHPIDSSRCGNPGMREVVPQVGGDLARRVLVDDGPTPDQGCGCVTARELSWIPGKSNGDRRAVDSGCLVARTCHPMVSW